MEEYNIVQSDGKNYLRGTTVKAITMEVIINGTPKDLTNTNIRIQFRKGSKTGAVALDFNTGSGITKTDPTNGLFRLDEFNTTKLLADKYYYDVQFIDGSVISKYVGGYMILDQDVTRNE